MSDKLFSFLIAAVICVGIGFLIGGALVNATDRHVVMEAQR